MFFQHIWASPMRPFVIHTIFFSGIEIYSASHHPSHFFLPSPASRVLSIQSFRTHELKIIASSPTTAQATLLTSWGLLIFRQRGLSQLGLQMDSEEAVDKARFA